MVSLKAKEFRYVVKWNVREREYERKKYNDDGNHLDQPNRSIHRSDSQKNEDAHEQTRQ